MRHEPESQAEWDERENEFYFSVHGDPLLEIELDYAMEKMDVKPTDPNYGFWRGVAEHDLQSQPIKEG